MAEGLFRQYLCERGLDFISVKSAGLAAAVGLPPSDNAVEADDFAAIYGKRQNIDFRRT